MDMIGNVQKFSLAEMTSNDNGKTSGSGTMGILVTVCGCIVFLYGSFMAAAVVPFALTAMGFGAGLLGVRKWQQTNQSNEQNNSSGSEAAGDK